MRSAAFAVALTILAAVFASAQQESESWIDSAEAYFATDDERKEWPALASRNERDAFKERYWLRRDPTPGTLKNEFRELVRNRIRYADQNFAMTDTPGSLTGRGRVFVVFGGPARQRHDRNAPPPTSAPSAGATPRVPLGWVEGTESTFSWIYDRERTPEVVKILGVPSFEITMVADVNRRLDKIQNPGLFARYREIFAKKSIVNPDLIPPVQPARAIVAEFAPASFGTDTAHALRDALLQTGNDYTFGRTIHWNNNSEPETYVWFFVPEETAKTTSELMLAAAIAGEGQKTLSLTAPASPSNDLFATTGGRIAAARLTLPAGRYEGSFALIDRKTNKTLASARTPMVIPSLDREFAVSTLVLSGGVTTARPEDDRGAFRFGDADVLQRADRTFHKSEMMWVFFEIANPSDPNHISIDIKLRSRDGKIRPADVPPELQQTAPGRFFTGFEMRLGGLEAGDYMLYVTVRDGEREELRRADFRLSER